MTQKQLIEADTTRFSPLPLALLAGSVLALLFAPTLMPESYSWLGNTTSESAAQGVPGAWLARLGFLLFGFGVLWIARSQGSRWGLGVYLLHAAFGILMIATAAFSTRSWEVGAAFDSVEESLHSFTATAMGFAFAFGVGLRMVQRLRRGGSGWLWDAIALSAATFIPLAMNFLPGVDGLLQRLMFGIAYLWYAGEQIDGGKHPAKKGRGG